MNEFTKYEGDQDFVNLYLSGVNEELLLDFIFKKKGSVSLNDLNYSFNKTMQPNNLDISVNALKFKGLVKLKEGNALSVTRKARWVRFYTHQGWQFVAAVASIAALIVGLLSIIKGSSGN